VCAVDVGQIDYDLPVTTRPPAGYPAAPVSDTYTARSFDGDYQIRRQALLDHLLCNPAPANLKAPYYELARLSAGGIPHMGVFDTALNCIDQRQDCADFVLHSILRLLYQFGEREELPGALLERARQTVLGFKYWPDEPGLDSMCTWTENHQILFASGAYLAGQRYPELPFSNSGHSGWQMMAIHRPRILRWLDLRFRTGFSEWLSNFYYDADLVALASLVDFCDEAEIRRRSAMVLDLVLYDMALHNFRGAFGCSHGRSYERGKKLSTEEDTADTQKLLFGLGQFTARNSMSAICLALSPRYRMPRVLYEVANDQQCHTLLNRQRMGIRLAEAGRWGLGFDNFEDGMVLLSLEAYHPYTITLLMDMFDAFRWWENAFYEPFKARQGLIQVARRLGILPLVAHLFERDITRNTREEVNIYTYRTPDYMLSSAQDYRPGYGGDQQHIWQATLGPGAVCFTTHPARRQGPSPNYWTGSGTLPRVAQVENVALVIYNVSTRPGLYLTHRLRYTHAWLPRDRFDEVLEQDGWIFARRGDGYLALRSQHPCYWQAQPGEDQNRELIAPGKQNIWICELGRRAASGGFVDFVEEICQAGLSFGRLRVDYQSPSQGHLSFGWRDPLRQNGTPMPLGNYPRYDNAYSKVLFPANAIAIRHHDHWLELNWQTASRKASGYV
jgi:hypothetical protein